MNALLLCLLLAKSPETDAPYPVELAMLAETNAFRAKHGKAPLELDTTLLVSARKHAIWMCEHGMKHGRSGGVWMAENIAMGQRDAADVVVSWSRSSGHRRNMLGNYTKVGVAGYTYNGKRYWTMQLR